MNETFEDRLREEIKDLRKLQTQPSMKGILDIYYKDSRGQYKTILNPTVMEDLYEDDALDLKVRYTMPMYVEPGVLKKDWSAAVLLKVTEPALLEDANLGVSVDGGHFPDGSVPFNKHISRGWICTGFIWKDAIKNGIWYFVICLGGLFNLEPEMQAKNGDHLNGRARVFFEEVRHKQPTNKIAWPVKLRELGFTITRVKPTFTIKPL